MITFGYNCPHCGVKNGGFEIKGSSVHSDKDRHNFSLMAVCNRCKNAIVANTKYLARYIAEDLDKALNGRDWVALETILHKHNLEQFDFSPKTEEPNIPDHLPERVLEKLRGAEKLYIQSKGDALMLNYSGTGYRATLEKALEHFETSQNKNLNYRINQLVSQGVLVQAMGGFAHRIRALGNVATHDEINFDELTELRLFTQLFLQYVFTLPAMIPDNKKAYKNL